MKGLFAISAMIALATPLAIAQTSTYTLDPAHSSVDFTVRHLSLSNVHGRFGKVTGTIQMDAADMSKSSVQVTIDVTGIDTGVTPRDNDLKSDHFFNVAVYPTATFTSTSVTKSSSGLTIAGNLTVHGVSKPVTLQVDGPAGPVSGMDHKPHIGFSATATLNRMDFGIGPGYPDSMIGDQIQLTIDLDAGKQQ